MPVLPTQLLAATAPHTASVGNSGSVVLGREALSRVAMLASAVGLALGRSLERVVVMRAGCAREGLFRVTRAHIALDEHAAPPGVDEARPTSS